MGTATHRWGLVLGLFVLACAQDQRQGTGWTTVAATIGPGADAGEDSGTDASSGGEESTGEADSAPVQDDGGEDEATASGGTDGDHATSATTEGGETGTGDPVLDACLAMATNPCEQCACNMCLDPLYACQQDAGCVAMRDCAEMSGCQGAEACYSACMGVIDQYGGPFGDSAALALALSDCLEPACPVCFQ